MALITPWTTLAPAQQDVPGVQQPDLVDDSLPGAYDGDIVLASQVMALRDKLQNAYQEIGTTPGNLPITSLRARVAALEGAPLPLTGMVTTLDATPTPIITQTLADPSVAWFDAVIIGRSTSGAARMLIKLYVLTHREGGGAAVDDWFVPYQWPLAAPWTVGVAPVGDDIVFSVTGAVGVPINWHAIIGYQPVT
jgi:hypothetical protein